MRGHWSDQTQEVTLEQVAEGGWRISRGEVATERETRGVERPPEKIPRKQQEQGRVRACLRVSGRDSEPGARALEKRAPDVGQMQSQGSGRSCEGQGGSLPTPRPVVGVLWEKFCHHGGSLGGGVLGPSVVPDTSRENTSWQEGRCTQGRPWERQSVV